MTPEPSADIDAALLHAMVAALTLEEKASLTVGRDFFNTQDVPRVGIDAVWLADGPNGLRKNAAAEPAPTSVPATCFPSASALGASWDTALVREVGAAIGEEAQAQGVGVVLAPGLNLKRSPLCGRDFEYYSEDPILSGRLGAAFVQGVQAQGVGACPKHFVANENERVRYTTDSIVDQQTLRELYLRSFELCVTEAAPWMVMVAYNRINGVHCVENPWLLSTVLKGEWGYRGVTVSDWYGVDDRVLALQAGLHLQMPHGPSAPAVVDAVRQGRLAESDLDALVRDLVALAVRAEAGRQAGAVLDGSRHHALARRAAAAGMVLLKNDGGHLPMLAEGSVAVIGRIAREPRFQGRGSAQVNALTVETAWDELIAAAADPSSLSYAPGYGADDQTTDALLAEAARVARASRLAVVFVGLPEGAETEGADRTDLDLPAAHDALVEAVLAVQPNVAVVISSGAPVTMPWAGRTPAIVQAWLGGEAGGGAIADVLLGRADPGGRLAETFPVRLADTASYHSFPTGGQRRAPFSEGLFTGYRWHDMRDIEPLFPFGHGLSYTTFAYEAMAIDSPALRPGGRMAISVTVRNTGMRRGSEVIQLYVHEREPQMPRPLRELKAFAKVTLAPGDVATVTLELWPRDFATFDPDAGVWFARPGVYDLHAGASSRDLRLTAAVSLVGTAGDSHLGRESTFAEWLAHPRGRALVEPLLHRPDVAILGNVDDFPLLKLAVMGLIPEAEVDALVAAAAAAAERPHGSMSQSETPPTRLPDVSEHLS
jgi:beta-glucosidase